MSRQRHGSIVNCASVAGLRAADSLSTSYTASKHALLGLTRALAVEYAADGVRVNALCPGVIDTGMLDGMADELQADLRRKNPAARLGTAHEVAVAAEFLLSDRSSYVSGTTLTLDAGGLTGAL
jgi:NAD(P)-dependent dehydrogenase (short-subunit alcohol dehydrogenase family)